MMMFHFLFFIFYILNFFNLLFVKKDAHILVLRIMNFIVAIQTLKLQVLNCR